VTCTLRLRKPWPPTSASLRDLTPAFGLRGIRRSLLEAAEQALQVDDPECREIAEQLLREVRKIRV
jgi:hypothetical protein